jgi:hypothetical protein
MDIAFKDHEIFRDDFRYANSARAIRRFDDGRELTPGTAPD